MLRLFTVVFVVAFPLVAFPVAYTSNVGGGGSGFWDVGASWNPDFFS